MKKRNNWVVLFGVLLSWTIVAHAGWYVVDSYEGHIGPYPVHLSLQKEDFGSGLNMEGSYYYDSHHAPIPLYGKMVGTTIEVCEVHNASEYEKYLVQGSRHGFATGGCAFKLTSGDNILRGTWQDPTHRYDVSLTRTASLDDTASPGTTKGDVRVPFWGQTSTHSFVGLYQGTADGLAIHRIEVINKKTGKVDQIIDPQLYGCQFGFFTTPIYMNLESETDASSIRLNCYSKGQYDNTVEYRFDRANHSYRAIGGN